MRLADRHDLDGRIADFLQKPVQRRALEQDLPSRPRALAEDDVRDASRLAKAIRPSAGMSAFTRTTVAPSSSASAMLRCSASRSAG